ncbi:hypothetical protein BJV77DRAFT_1006781, partial [Russula vinacea]
MGLPSSTMECVCCTLRSGLSGIPGAVCLSPSRACMIRMAQLLVGLNSPFARDREEWTRSARGA